jgi:uncharacterized protein (TIGR03067 family)
MRYIPTVWLTGLLLGLAVPTSVQDKSSAAARELKKLQGVWGTYFDNYSHSHGTEVIAQPLTELSKHRIRGNKWQSLDKRGKPTGAQKTITLDPSTNPKQIRFSYTRKGEDGKPDQKVTEYGIYRLEKDRLTVHFGPFDGRGGTKAAPKQFLQLGKPAKGVDGLAMQFVRVKED